MELKNCNVCGKIFVYFGNKTCRNCVEELEQAYIKVRDYIYKNPDADILKLVEDTGVDEKLILQMLREGRLQLRNEDPSLGCMKCGKPIKMGYYCKMCARDLQTSIEKITGKSLNEPSRNSKFDRNRYHSIDVKNRKEDK